MMSDIYPFVGVIIVVWFSAMALGSGLAKVVWVKECKKRGLIEHDAETGLLVWKNDRSKVP